MSACSKLEALTSEREACYKNDKKVQALEAKLELERSEKARLALRLEQERVRREEQAKPNNPSFISIATPK
eukprot:1944452-Amphidinium_carterae.1